MTDNKDTLLVIAVRLWKIARYSKEIQIKARKLSSLKEKLGGAMNTNNEAGELSEVLASQINDETEILTDSLYTLAKAVESKSRVFK